MKINIQGSWAQRFHNLKILYKQINAEGCQVVCVLAICIQIANLVVNLWERNCVKPTPPGTQAWREDTLAAVYSGGKGLTTQACVDLLADRGRRRLRSGRPGGSS